MHPQLTGCGNHGDGRPGVEGGQHAEQAAGVLLQAVVHLHVVSVTRPVQLEVREPEDDLEERAEAVSGRGSGKAPPPRGPTADATFLWSPVSISQVQLLPGG